jgi:hypothetical protein
LLIHGNRFWKIQTEEAIGNRETTTAKRSEIGLCVLKPDELVLVVNTIFINHLPEDCMVSSHGSVGKANTHIDNEVRRQYKDVTRQAVDFGDSWQEFCF